MSWWVYLLRCGDGSLYTGSTDDVERRLAVHQSGRGAKYTRSHLPVELVYREAAADRSAALRREAAVKRLSRAEKLRLVEGSPIHWEVPMRRKDREQSPAFAWDVAEACTYGVVSMTGAEGSPYGVPVNLVRQGDRLYFHCAREGRKLDCLRQNPQVCVTWVGNVHVQQERFTTRYESAIAFGDAAEVEDDAERREALRLLCQRYTPDAMDGFDRELQSAFSHTAVVRIQVREITGKRNQ